MLEEMLIVNPRRRKRRSRKSRSARRRYRSRARGGFRTRRRRLTNPRFKLPSVGGITRDLIPAAIGAGGALALDVGMAYAGNYLPDQLKSGWGKTLAMLGGALALGYVAAWVPGVGKRNAQIATLGALTIVAYNALRPLAAQAIGDKVKGLNGLADFGDYEMGAYMNPRLGAYMNAAPALLPSAARSPVAAAQSMGAYMGATGGDYF